MAQKLSDVIFRRTELGTGGHPGQDTLAYCAQVMGRKLGWNLDKIQQELQEVNVAFYPAAGAYPNGSK